jgi:hypothetical protein
MYLTLSVSLLLRPADEIYRFLGRWVGILLLSDHISPISLRDPGMVAMYVMRDLCGFCGYRSLWNMYVGVIFV